MAFKVRLKVSTVRQDLTSDGNELQVCTCSAAIQHVRRASSVLGTDVSDASDDRRDRTGTAAWIRLHGYAGVMDNNYIKDQTKRCISCSIPPIRPVCQRTIVSSDITRSYIHFVVRQKCVTQVNKKQETLT